MGRALEDREKRTVEVQDLTRDLLDLQMEEPRAMLRFREMASAEGEDLILLCLLHTGDSMLAGDLADLTGLTSGRIANILRRLEERGYISRTQGMRDRRKVHVSLTGAGEEKSRQVLLEAGENWSGLLEDLGTEDAGSLVRILKRCAAFYDKVE